MESYEMFVEAVSQDAQAYATHLTNDSLTAHSLVQRSLNRAYHQLLESGHRHGPVLSRVVVYRTMLKEVRAATAN